MRQYVRQYMSLCVWQYMRLYTRLYVRQNKPPPLCSMVKSKLAITDVPDLNMPYRVPLPDITVTLRNLNRM